MVAFPLSAFKSPRSIRIVVVLPAPFGPINPQICPSFTSSDRLSKAVTGPKVFVTWLTLITLNPPNQIFFYM